MSRTCRTCDDDLKPWWPADQPFCGDCLDGDVFCSTHGKELPMGPYGVRYGGCEDCEPPEPDGEAFRGGEAAAYARDQMAAWQRLK